MRLADRKYVTNIFSRCSRECGGGTRHLVTRCYHPVTGKVRLRVSFKYVSPRLQRIRNRLCGPKRSRPGRREKSCNTFRSGLRKLDIASINPEFRNSCDMDWVVGDWEPCTSSCGKDGTRKREVGGQHCYYERNSLMQRFTVFPETLQRPTSYGCTCGTPGTAAT